jgi:response regulator RpfG family c-di-GMP phosphodiesterase
MTLNVDGIGADVSSVMGKPTVLVVDDDHLLRNLLRETFELEGIAMREAGHVIEAEKIIAAELPDAIVLDVGLPGVDGLFYCERLRESPRTRSVPIIVISGSREAGVSALTVGAQGFFAKPFDPLQLLSMLERLLGLDPFQHVTRTSGYEPEVIGDLRRLIAIGQRQHELLEVSYRQTVEALAAALESRDFGTSAHSQRVTSYATRLTLELSPGLIDDTSLEWGFLLHDVGKIGVPDRILLKRGPLDEAERSQMEEHTTIGESLLAHVPLLHGEGLGVVRSHHERWDGTGYPDGLAAEAIPLGARIFAVADALDAMTNDRPYRHKMPWDRACRELQDGAGTHFDPTVIDALTVCEPDLFATHASVLASTS